MTVIDERPNFGVVKGGKLVDADDMADTHTSKIVDMRGTTGKLSIHLKVGVNADAAGTLKVKQSNFPETDDGVDVVFLDGSSSVAVTAAATLSKVLDLEVYARYVWVLWTFSGGTGTNQLDVIAEVKK